MHLHACITMLFWSLACACGGTGASQQAPHACKPQSVSIPSGSHSASYSACSLESHSACSFGSCPRAHSIGSLLHLLSLAQSHHQLPLVCYFTLQYGRCLDPETVYPAETVKMPHMTMFEIHHKFYLQLPLPEHRIQIAHGATASNTKSQLFMDPRTRGPHYIKIPPRD